MSEGDGIGVLLKENTDLIAAISSLKEEINKVKVPTDKPDGDAKAIALLDKLATKDEELLSARHEIEETKAINKELAERLAETDSIIQELRRSLDASLNSTAFINQLKELALDATGGDKKFKHLIENARFETQFVYDIFNKCLAEIRTLLHGAAIEKLPESAAEVISIAKDTNLIPVEAAHLAHFIRAQRNALAHNENLHPKTINARVLACLFVAALLWPEFPE